MITLVYGDDLEAVEFKTVELLKNKEFERVDGSKIKFKDIEEKLLGKSLFGGEKTFLIENLLKNKAKKEIFKLIEENEGLDLILIERSKLNKRDLAIFKFGKVSDHILPQYYFKFLDDFRPGNSLELAKLYQNLLKSMSAEQVFYSLIKRVRALIAVKTNNLNHSEVSRFAPWQMGKLKSQASFWTQKELFNFYKVLFEIELKMKSSQLPLSLEKYIDIAILSELN